MKKILCIGLAILITLVTLKDFIIYAEYAINKDFIVKNLCINRAKPETKCDGKCHLNKRLQESRQEQESLPFTLIDKGSSINLICQELNVHLSGFLEECKNRIIRNKAVFYTFSIDHEHFHPPEV